MKNVSICMMLLFTITVISQRPGLGKMDKQNPLIEKMKGFTPEQEAALKSKRLTLALDLNESQQQAVKTLALEKTKKRMDRRLDKEAIDKLSTEEFYQLSIANLEHQIAFKSSMKSILNEEQFSRWEAINIERRKHRGKTRQITKAGQHGKKR